MISSQSVSQEIQIFIRTVITVLLIYLQRETDLARLMSRHSLLYKLQAKTTRTCIS